MTKLTLLDSALQEVTSKCFHSNKGEMCKIGCAGDMLKNHVDFECTIILQF